MDNLTHALIGAGLIGLGKIPAKERRGTWLAVMLGSQLPDLDLLPGLLEPQAQVVLHRSYSHSLLGLTVVAGFMTLGLGVLDPRMPLKKTFMWVSLAFVAHVFFDLLTSYGTRVLIPFTDRVVALDVLYGMDLVITVVLGIGCFLYFKGWRQALAVAMGVVFVYVGARWAVHTKIYNTVGKKLGESPYSVVPGLNPIGNWLVVIDKGKVYSLAEAGLFSGKISPIAEFPKNLEHPLVNKVTRNPVVDSYLHIARYPYATVTQDGTGWRIKFTDLRLWPHLTFNAIVIMDYQLEVKKVKVGPIN